MPIYLGVHDFGGPFTEDQMKANWAKYQESAKNHGATPHKVFYNAEEGKSYCITEAESADVVNEAHNAVDLPTKELHEVSKLK
ncbi:MAG TPA: nickel-binding protein [Candidatus Saccharimonadales bacterium]|nr:nickel-binding protein [Candidatus Saccharimonadales bacterium]